MSEPEWTESNGKKQGTTEKEDKVDVLDDMSVTLAVLHFERSALNLKAE